MKKFRVKISCNYSDVVTVESSDGESAVDAVDCDLMEDHLDPFDLMGYVQIKLVDEVK